jgi:hypothetical protein
VIGPWLALLLVAWWQTPAVLLSGLLLAAATAWLGWRLGRWERLLLAGDGQAPRNRL